MSEIKWIKLTVNVFDDEKFDAIKTLPDSNNIQLAWVKLLCLAGKCNENGFLMLTREIPYTDEMLAQRFDMDIGVVQRAMSIFQQLNMIEVVDNIYMVSNWLKYQSGERLEEIKEANRRRQKKYREKQRALNLIPTNDKLCVYCGDVAESVDHIIPKSKGGTDDTANLVPVCISCNCSKKDKDLAVFLNDDLEYGKRLNHELIRQNCQLMSFVEYDSAENKYRNVTVTQREYVTPSISYSFISNSNINNLIYLIDNNKYKDSNYIKDNIDLYNGLKEWMIYKDNKRPKSQHHYDTELGISKLLTQAVNASREYGVKNAVDAIDYTISNNYQGIIWDRASQKPSTKRNKQFDLKEWASK